MIITYSWFDQYKIIGANDISRYFGIETVILPKYKAFGVLSDKKPIATIAGD